MRDEGRGFWSRTRSEGPRTAGCCPFPTGINHMQLYCRPHLCPFSSAVRLSFPLFPSLSLSSRMLHLLKEETGGRREQRSRGGGHGGGAEEPRVFFSRRHIIYCIKKSSTIAERFSPRSVSFRPGESNLFFRVPERSNLRFSPI